MENGQRVTVYYQYYPEGVKRVITNDGCSAYIGEVDDFTVLKYPKAKGGDMTRLNAEKKLFEIIGLHERIIKFKGSTETGLLLERAANGSLLEYFKSDNPPPSKQQRLAWCRETAEALVHVHSCGVIHCDIQPGNILLDEQLHVKLSDFQGKYLTKNGTVLVDGWSSEPTRFCCPRENSSRADVKTDLFALGCLIYFIMRGHAVFPDIIDGEDGWHEMVEERFDKGQFPQEPHACDSITSKCWKQEYNSAEELLRDVESVEKLSAE
ncbi:kinase-like domain-containing protein [Nemania abortiva]|nr:kinase-like domain-containing protein [Nemania abortiva]